MTSGRKDGAAFVLTALVVLTFAAAHEGWNVWFVGDSHRWAAGVILALGTATCALGSPARGAGGAKRLLSVLGMLAAVLAVLALATASLTALSFLTADVVLLWAASTTRHLGLASQRFGHV